MKVGTKSVYDLDKHLEAIKNLSIKEVSDRSNATPKTLEAVLKKYIETFESEGKAIIDAHKNELEEERHKKQRNDEIIEEINGIERKKKDIIMELEKTEEIRENL